MLFTVTKLIEAGENRKWRLRREKREERREERKGKKKKRGKGENA